MQQSPVAGVQHDPIHRQETRRISLLPQVERHLHGVRLCRSEILLPGTRHQRQPIGISHVLVPERYSARCEVFVHPLVENIVVCVPGADDRRLFLPGGSEKYLWKNFDQLLHDDDISDGHFDCDPRIAATGQIEL